MIGFTAAFANTIKEIFSKYTPEKYQEVFYKILKEATYTNELYYTWDNEFGSYGDLKKILLENGFEVEEDYEDYYGVGLIITW